VEKINNLFILVLSLSLSGTILALILLSIKPLIENRISKSIQYYIWIIVLLRLTIPFSLEENLMNKIFYNNDFPRLVSTNQKSYLSNDEDSLIIANAPITLDVKEKTEIKTYNHNIANENYFVSLINMFNDYAFYIYLLGVIITIAINTASYHKFLRKLQVSLKNVTVQENLLLASLAEYNKKIRLFKSPLVNTPMLVGILNPKIIIPDINYNEKQLKHILSHELIHYKRFDIGLKWLTMLATSIHWFNPMMILIRKEINNICELSCDEAVIKNLNNDEKQEYGDTLIFTAAQYRHPSSRLQATMCAEKKALRKRLLAIMNYNKQSNLKILTSILLFTMTIFSSLFLGACTIRTPKEPPQVIITNETDYSQAAYTILKNKWNGEENTQYSFYETAKKNNLFSDLRFTTADEKIKIDFGKFKPDSVSVKVALFEDINSEAPLKVLNVPVYNNKGIYEFNSPYNIDLDDNEVKAKCKIFSISSTWGKNSCEYIFVTETPSYFSKSTNPAENNTIEVSKLQTEAGNRSELDLLDVEKVALEFLSSKEFTEYIDYRNVEGINKNPISISNFSDYIVVKYGLKNPYGYIELKLIHPQNSDNCKWIVDSYNVKLRTYAE